jgi:hypothetical protein
MAGAYEFREDVTDDTIEHYIRPHLTSSKRTNDLVRFILAFDNVQTVRIAPKLRELNIPTQIISGDGDIFFGET